MAKPLTVKDLPDYLISQGRYSASTEELAGLVGRGGLRSGLARLRGQKRVFSPARGLYVFVPPQYRSWGVIPADWFIDAMMSHLQRRYYVGLLAAAARHGAAHQAPQVFQVFVDRELENRAVGRVRLRFFTTSHLAETPVEEQNAETGTVKISSREATVIDLVDRPRAAGGLNNIATILSELGRLEGDELARLSGLRARSHARRLGWMLTRFSPETDASPVRELAQPDRGGPSTLSASGPRRGALDAEWGLMLNTTVEPDL